MIFNRKSKQCRRKKLVNVIKKIDSKKETEITLSDLI